MAVSVALPAAMFLPMATLDLAGLRWGVVTSVAAAKAGTWLLGALGGYLMGTTPGNRCAVRPAAPLPGRVVTPVRGSVAMAGIVSMFATCSNDTVFGLPIFEAVLPGNVADIYSVAPVQLLVFNPLSMAVIALGDDARDASGRKLSAAAKLRGVAASVLNNPIVRWSCRCGGPQTSSPH